MVLAYKSKPTFIIFVVLSYSISTSSKLVEEKCYEGLGCVRLTPEWSHPKYRPKNVLPADRHAVNTIFVLWSLYKKNVKAEILGSELRGVHINCCLKILVHDFTSNGYTGWIQHTSRALLTSPEMSGFPIVSVDWAAGAEPPYLQAVANARLVALEIVHFLNKIETSYKWDDKKVHIIGHGLGAHIAGYVGKLTRLYKITALDPSGPYFTSMPPQVKLHKDDAKFVEVIHTDASPRGQGSPELMGDVDIFPNGGRSQPGCVDSVRKITNVRRGDIQLGETLSACSHKRSLKYYIESLINKSCRFVAVACRSFKDFVKGQCLNCGANCQNCFSPDPISGPRELNNTGGFYLVTSDSTPFCGEIIKIMMEIKSDTEGSFVKGRFNVTIPQEIGDVNFMLNENHAIRALRTNEQHVFLVFRSTPPPLQLPAHSVQIQWIHSWVPCTWCTIPRITTFVIHKMSDDPSEAGSRQQWFHPVPDSEGNFEPKGSGKTALNKAKTEKTNTSEVDYIEHFIVTRI